MKARADAADVLAKVRSYQLEIYKNGMFSNISPRVTTDMVRLEEEAEKHIEPRAFKYVAGGAGEGATQKSNRSAFGRWQLVPRMMGNNPDSDRSLQTRLFGEDYASPIIQAPIGVQGVVHPEKEVGVAKACAELDIPFVLSTVATSSIEEVATAIGSGPRWFQLYWPKDDDITISLLQRAQNAGYTVLVVTLDAWAPAWRPLDLDTGYLPMISGIGNEIGFTDPTFRGKFKKAQGKEVEEDFPLASNEWLQCLLPGFVPTWGRIPFLKKHWKGAIVLKGIQHPDDARLALSAGCDGIVVSNHGGRQLDGAVGSLQMLPSIVDAVGDRMTVLFDSGVRTGVDILKALCLGAKGVMVGRPTMYGLGIAGTDGAREVLRGLLADLDRSIGLSGIKSLEDCNRSFIQPNEMP